MTPGTTTRERAAGAAGAQGLRGFEQRRVHPARRVGDDQHLLEERADEDDGDLGRVVDAEDGHRQRAERGRGQVAKELDERLVEPRDRGNGAAQDAERHAEQRRDREAPEDDADAVQRLSCSQGSSGRAGGVVKPVTSARATSWGAGRKTGLARVPRPAAARARDLGVAASNTSLSTS